jgi:uncharacterized membrane protein
MKKNTFYIICGLIAVSLLLLFWLSIEFSSPVIIAVSVVLAAVIFFVVKQRVTDIVQDERTILIDMKTASATIKTSVVLFLTVNLSMIVYVFSGPLGFHSFAYSIPRDPMILSEGYEFVPYFPVPPETIPISELGLFAVLQLIMIVAALFIYVGFRFYYVRKFGVWGEDEE